MGCALGRGRDRHRGSSCGGDAAGADAAAADRRRSADPTGRVHRRRPLQIRNKLDGHGTHVSNSKQPSRTVVAKITVQPGAQFPWHTHPGPVIVNVAQGELTYVMAHDCVDRPYGTGTAFVDPGRGMVHTAVNRTSGVTVIYATFFEVPQTGPLTIPVDAPADCTP